MSHRTLSALRLAVRQTDDRAQLDQALVEIARRLARDDLLQHPLDLRPRPSLHNIIRICQEPCHHAQHIAVDRRLRDIIDKRADRSRCIAPDSLQGTDLLILVRKFTAIIFHDLDRSSLQVARPVIISQSLPQLQQTLLRHLCQSLHVRQLLKEPLIVRPDRLHSRLLQHDL